MIRAPKARAQPLGLLLKQWRRLRGKSQLALAIDTGVSPRHLAFVESGRAQPSREFLVLLADGLQVPLRERNVLLAAAGFSPLYPETDLLGAGTMGPLQNALERLLSHQEPYPAVLLDRHWNVLQTNRAAPRLFNRFIDLDKIPKPRNLLRTLFNPDGLAPWIENWEVVAHTLIQRVFREAVAGIPDPRTLELLSELGAWPLSGATEALVLSSPLPFHPVIFRRDALRLSFFSMLTTVGAPFDITAQELRIEAFFPADAATEAFARDHLASG